MPRWRASAATAPPWSAISAWTRPACSPCRRSSSVATRSGEPSRWGSPRSSCTGRGQRASTPATRPCWSRSRQRSCPTCTSVPDGVRRSRPAEFLGLLPFSERAYVTQLLRRETVGGALILVAATVALVWANSPWRAAYTDLQQTEIGPQALDLHLSLSEWAGSGLLAIFFFVAGLELKRELVHGTLRRPAEAVLPVAAAVIGMAVPALIYLAVTAGDAEAARGWAIPTATDIAFCLAVLAVVGRRLPAALRAFLLTLAVVDDLIAIVIIAVFYSDGVAALALAGSAAALAMYGLLQRRGIDAWPVLVLVALAAWGLMHASGVHP